MAYTSIDDPELYFQVKTYTGDGGTTQALTLGGSENMQPDLVWVKMRSEGQSHILVDSVRGANKYLGSNHDGGEGTDINSVTAFGSNGFTVGNDNAVNKSSGTYVAWNWKESATAGFDILTYTGNDTNRTISHSLSAVPHWILIKATSRADSWRVYHHKNTSAPATDYLVLNVADATSDSASEFQDTVPTSSVFTLGTSGNVNRNSETFVAYLWSEKKGFSKFGSFVGNANTDGPFVYTGFRPAWVLIKNSSANGENWNLFDNKRNGFNGSGEALRPNTNEAEYDRNVDFLANGFKVRDSSGEVSGSGNTLVYMAFAESPLVNSNGVPTNAR
tara:strand:- start:551 stop:1546 length:996 start_codon:yes stop_codon:yes gene_type:complete